LIASRPIHTTINWTQREVSLGIAASQLLKNAEHAILIETAIPKIHFGVRPKLRLTTPMCSRQIDSCGSQALQMVALLLRINDVNRFVAIPEPL